MIVLILGTLCSLTLSAIVLYILLIIFALIGKIFDIKKLFYIDKKIKKIIFFTTFVITECLLLSFIFSISKMWDN